MNYKRVIKKIVSNFNKLIFLKRSKTLKPAEVRNILFISLYFRGDYLFHTVLIKFLGELLPKAKLDIWIKSHNEELTFNNPHINEVLVFNNIKTASYNDNSKLDIKGKHKFFKKIRKRKYDLVLDVTGKISTALFVYFSKAKYTVGINNYGFGACYDKFIDLRPASVKGHLIEKYLRIAKYAFNIDDNKWNDLVSGLILKPYIYITEKEQLKVEELLHRLKIYDNKLLIIIHSSAGWSAKEWGANNYSILIERLRERGIKFLFIGDEKDHENFKLIIANSKLKHDPDVSNYFLKLKILEVAELIKRSDIFIGSDSAPLHLAGAVGTPTIGLFGPTNPEFSNPLGDKHKILYHKLHCSATEVMQYCSRKGGMTCKTVDCMKLIKVEKVMDLIEKSIYEKRKEKKDKTVISSL